LTDDVIIHNFTETLNGQTDRRPAYNTFIICVIYEYILYSVMM